MWVIREGDSTPSALDGPWSSAGLIAADGAGVTGFECLDIGDPRGRRRRGERVLVREALRESAATRGRTEE